MMDVLAMLLWGDTSWLGSSASAVLP